MVLKQTGLAEQDTALCQKETNFFTKAQRKLFSACDGKTVIDWDTYAVQRDASTFEIIHF